MTDHTLSISNALREAKLQRLEAALTAKAAFKPQATTQPAKDEVAEARD